MRAVEMIVCGRVQGVFYRVGAREQAERLGVRGWIRNRDDGAVVARVEGPPEAVERFVEWARHGPPAAQIESVDVVEVAPDGATAFDVLH